MSTSAAIDFDKLSKLSIQEIIRHIEDATSHESLFRGDANKIYHILAKGCHTDRLIKESLATQQRGLAAFTKLNLFYQRYNGKVVSPSPVVFGKWVVDKPITGGDLADLYNVTTASGEHAILKIVRNAADNDLLNREIVSLKKLHDDKRNDNFKRYIPKIIQQFKASERQAIVINNAQSDLLKGGVEQLVPLSKIVSLLGKVPFRHVVWMSNRLLNVLGFSHHNGIIHGAILPPHLMYGPIAHTMMLVDWCYSVTSDNITHIPALVKDYRAWYPREVIRKEKPGPGTDIYMWAMMVTQVSDNIPKRFKPLLDWCLSDSMKTRPEYAWHVHDRWGKLAYEEFGKPRYHELNLPQT